MRRDDGVEIQRGVTDTQAILRDGRAGVCRCLNNGGRRDPYLMQEPTLFRSHPHQYEAWAWLRVCEVPRIGGEDVHAIRRYRHVLLDANAAQIRNVDAGALP